MQAANRTSKISIIKEPKTPSYPSIDQNENKSCSINYEQRSSSIPERNKIMITVDNNKGNNKYVSLNSYRLNQD